MTPRFLVSSTLSNIFTFSANFLPTLIQFYRKTPVMTVATLIVHDDSALFCICASQYLEFEGKSFCALLYTHYRACSTYVWHGLIWNPSVTGGKSAKLLILLYQSQYLSADYKIF